MAGREHDEEEIWRDLVARLDSPAADEDAREAAPWPAEENVDARSFGTHVVKPADPDASAEEPVLVPHGEPVADPDDADEHYIPPPPPPLPHLDPITKGAWLGLFGGPAYLLVATIAGWTVPAWAAFGAVAAFIGGFITLVLRMSDEGCDESGPDDGAVV
jgi:hypothetical protein